MTNTSSKTTDGNNHHSPFDKIRANSQPQNNTSMDPSSSTSSFVTPSSDGYANSDDSWSLVSQDGDGINFNDIVSTDGSVEDDDNENLEDIITRDSSALSNHNNKKSSSTANPFSPLDFEDDENDDEDDLTQEELMQASSNSRITRLSVSTLNDLNPESSTSFSIPKIRPPTSSDLPEKTTDSQITPDSKSASKKSSTVKVSSVKVNIQESKGKKEQLRGQKQILNDISKKVNFKQSPIGFKTFLYGIVIAVLGIFVTVAYNQINEKLLVASIKGKTIDLTKIPESHMPTYLEVCAKAEKELLDNLGTCFMVTDDDSQCFDIFNHELMKDKEFCKFSVPRLSLKANSIYLKISSSRKIEMANEGMNKLNDYYKHNLDEFLKFREYSIKQTKEHLKNLKPKVENLHKKFINQAKYDYSLLKPKISKIQQDSIEKVMDGYNWVAPRAVNLQKETVNQAKSCYSWLKPRVIDLKDQSIEQTKLGYSWLKPRVIEFQSQAKSALAEQSEKVSKEAVKQSNNFRNFLVGNLEPKLAQLQDSAKAGWTKVTSDPKGTVEETRSWVKHNYESVIKDSKKSLDYLKKVVQGTN